MKVLLLKSVSKVGKKDEVVEVAEGYAHHALFPKKLAVPATAAAVAKRDQRHQNEAAERHIRHTLLNTAIEELNTKEVVMKVRANAQGNLFSKIHPSDIVRFLSTEHRIAIDESHMVIPDIKKIGTYTIEVRDEEYRSTFTLNLI